MLITAGKMLPRGLSVEELREMHYGWTRAGLSCQLMDLSAMSGLSTEPAAILIIRDAVRDFQLDPDTMLNSLVEENPREKGKLYCEREHPLIREMSEMIDYYTGKDLDGLDIDVDFSREAIGFHGDDERNFVACVRLGMPRPLQFQWFYKGEPRGEVMEIPTIYGGDMYILSEKATGYEWQNPNIPVLRHAVAEIKPPVRTVRRRPRSPGLKPRSGHCELRVRC